MNLFKLYTVTECFPNMSFGAGMFALVCGDATPPTEMFSGRTSGVTEGRLWRLLATIGQQYSELFIKMCASFSDA